MKIEVTIDSDKIPPWSTITDSLRELFPGADVRVNGLNDAAVVETTGTFWEVARALGAADFVKDWDLQDGDPG